MTDSDQVEGAEHIGPTLTVGTRIKRRVVLAWALWDWGSSAYSAVITSFVFGPYVVRGVVGDARPGRT
jgi:UMF1 family MFS transporter